jgi:hypothetical protein
MALRRRDQERELGGVIVVAGDPIEYTGGPPSERSPFDPCYHPRPDGEARSVFGVTAATREPPRYAGEKINFEEIPIDRKDFDDDSGGFDDISALIDGLGERGSLLSDGMIDKWGIDGLEGGGFDLEGFLDEWGPGSGGFFDGVDGGGRDWFTGDGRGGLTSGVELVSDYYNQETGLGFKSETAGDPYVSDPLGTGWAPFAFGGGRGHFGAAGSYGGYSSASPEPGRTTTSADEKPNVAAGLVVQITLDSASKPAQKPAKAKEDEKSPRDVKPKDKAPSSVEQGVDDPKKPKPGTGTGTPDPMRDPVGRPASWDRIAWARLREFKPKTGKSDEGSWGGSEAGGSTRDTSGTAVRQVDWELVIGGGHTDPGREGDSRHYGPRRPKRVGRMKFKRPTSDDPTVFGPRAIGALNAGFRGSGRNTEGSER